jgi:hypothetical protein
MLSDDLHGNFYMHTPYAFHVEYLQYAGNERDNILNGAYKHKRVMSTN